MVKLCVPELINIRFLAHFNMSVFRKLSLFSKRDSKISIPPPVPIASPVEEETVDNAGSNKQRLDRSADDALLRK